MHFSIRACAGASLISMVGLAGSLLGGCGSDRPSTSSSSAGAAGAGTAGGNAAGHGGLGGSTAGGSSGSSATVAGNGGAGVSGNGAGSSGNAGATSSAGTGGSSGGAGGGAGSSGMGGGATTCPAGAALCDDFEAEGLGVGQSPWAIETANTNPDQTTHGKVELTSAKAAHGTHSVHITIPTKAAGDPAGGSPAFISETKTFPALANDLWGRMLVFYTPSGAMPDSHWVNVATVGGAAHADEMLRFGGSNGAKLNANELPSDTFATSATLLPQGKWACFEWHVTAGTNNDASMHFYLDGNELTDMAVQDGKGSNGNAVWHSVPFAKLQLGWEYWNGQFGGELWLDDVAIGASRMACPSP